MSITKGILRDSPAGIFLSYFSKGTDLQYLEGQPGYVVPDRYLLSEKKHDDRSNKISNVHVLDWYDESDPEHPYNWSVAKKSIATAIIFYLSFIAYGGASIYTSSIPGIVEEFRVSETTAIAGLSMYIFGYGFGPMIWSPIQEIPSIGRSSVYSATIFCFILCTIGTAVAQNIQTILVTRFFAGLFAAPAISTGAASMSDIWGNKPLFLPNMIGAWAMGAILGPTLTPCIGGFAADSLGWRWPNWILAMLAFTAFIIITFFLPESLHSNILHRRAQRMRNHPVHGTILSHLVTRHELENSHLSFGEVMVKSLWVPVGILMEPAPLFLSFYTGFVYALFYLFFESFPIVFGEHYGFNLGQQGLAFFGFFPVAAITYTCYCIYLKQRFEPLLFAGTMTVEHRLEIGFYAALFVPASSFFFGWTSTIGLHWIVPIIAASIYLPGLYLMFQSILVYLSQSYFPNNAAAMSGNALIRSLIAGAFPLFGQIYFRKMGVPVGSSILGGISIVMMIPLFLIKRYGKVLRSKSKYIVVDEKLDAERLNAGGH